MQTNMQLYQFSFVSKVLVASALISVGIKTLGPQVNLPDTTGLVITIVLLPSVIVGLALGLQYQLKHR
jgi:hypothetical protein